MEQSKNQSFTQRHKEAQQGGTEKGRARQQAQGKLSARERINLLFDDNSFEETDLLARSFLTPSIGYTDGVITGFGKVNGKTVAVFSQDFSIKGGSLGKRHAEKIVKIMDLAAKIGCPIIGILDSGGARIDEGIHALSGYGSIFMRNTRYSGVIPQISIVLGPCAGGAVYSPALTDIIIMTKEISHMFITGPQVIEQVLHETTTKESLGGTDVHGQKSGVAHIIAHDEQDCFEQVKQLLTYLPNNYLSDLPRTIVPSHNEKNPEDLLPQSINQAYNIKNIIDVVVDIDSWYELQALFAPNIVTGFARIYGNVIGIVANQPLHKAGTIDIDASCKAARFINLCNNFNIPIVSLVDVPGFLPGIDQEHNGIIRHGAKLLYAYAHATVPKITLILRKAFGGAYIVMGSKELGADFNFAWPTAQIAVLGPQAARVILHKNELSATDQEQQRNNEAFEAQYTSDYLHPFIAAEAGYLDAIIEPKKTREHLARTLSLCRTKVDLLPKKKSGNIPL